MMTAEEARQLAGEYARLSETSYARLRNGGALWEGRKDLKQVAFSQGIIASNLETIASNLETIAGCQA